MEIWNILAIATGVIIVSLNVLLLFIKVKKYDSGNLQALQININTRNSEIDRLEKVLAETKVKLQSLLGLIKSNLEKIKAYNFSEDGKIDKDLITRIESFYKNELEIIKAYSINPAAFFYQYDKEGHFGDLIKKHSEDYEKWIKELNNLKNENSSQGVNYQEYENTINTLQKDFVDLVNEFNSTNEIMNSLLNLGKIEFKILENLSKDSLLILNGIGVIVVLILSIISFV